MIDICIFGDEELDETGRDLVERIKGLEAEAVLKKLKELKPEEAAEEFVSLIGSLDHLWTGKDADYFRNVSAILFSLAERPGFYEALLKVRDSLQKDELPYRASMVVYSQ